jgi:hypothetical protein
MLGLLEAARWLLERDADVNAQNGVLGNELKATAANGHVQVTRLLLDGETDVHPQE